MAKRLLRRMHVYEQVAHFNMLAGQLVGVQASGGTIPSAAGASVATTAGASLASLAALLTDSGVVKGDVAREPEMAAGKRVDTLTELAPENPLLCILASGTGPWRCYGILSRNRTCMAKFVCSKDWIGASPGNHTIQICFIYASPMCH